MVGIISHLIGPCHERTMRGESARGGRGEDGNAGKPGRNQGREKGKLGLREGLTEGKDTK